MKFILAIVFIVFSSTVFAETYGTCEETALVIIDMQPYFVERKGHAELPENKRKLDALIRNQIKVINEAKKNDMSIIIVEYEDSGLTFSPLIEALGDYDKAILVTKTTDGLFEDENDSKDELMKFLIQQSISNLIMIGANGGACVKWSLYGALAENRFNVYAFPDGIADFNYSRFVYPYRDKYDFDGVSDFAFSEIDSFPELASLMAGPPQIDEVNEDEYEYEYEEYIVDGNYYCDDSTSISPQ